MQEKVVYFLGAGFSAPLGLPVMSDFLLKSKDLYFGSTQEYAHFLPIFQTIEGMGKAKNYYIVDLFNIEEILSLLEMDDYVGAAVHRQGFLEFLRDVVLAYTPVLKPRESKNHWPISDLSENLLGNFYATFVSSLFGLRLTR